jgi:hypothetical protein
MNVAAQTTDAYGEPAVVAFGGDVAQIGAEIARLCELQVTPGLA